MRLPDRWRLYAPRLMEITLLLLTAWWVFSALQIRPSMEHLPASKNWNPAEKAQVISLQPLTNVALFGRPDPLTSVEAKVVAPEARSHNMPAIKLFATVVAGERSAAIMTVGTSAETTFFLGDVLFDRAFLKKVEADAVILSHQGNDERVSLVKEK